MKGIILRGLKLRENNIRKIIADSMKDLKKPDSIIMETVYDLDDEVVRMDYERIVKILADLETNAIEAMPEGGYLKILVEGDKDWVFITIHDTGHGISNDHMNLLFTPFFTTKPMGEGSGLGLPSAYGVVKAHGGHIKVESNADSSLGHTGTAIRISLPRWLALKSSNGLNNAE